MKVSKKSGFTLIELLVVVAIIAIIGAGVGVMYNRLDERAKVAMEINDIGTLEKMISHWSFLHDGNLPNGLDSLIQTDKTTLYSAMADGTGNANGLSMQAGFTFVSEKAPEYVLSQLSNVGIKNVYLHYPDVRPANESTYTNDTSAAKKMDVSGTFALLDADLENTVAQATAIVAAKDDIAASISGGTINYIVNWTDKDGNEQHTDLTGAPGAVWPVMLARYENIVSTGGGNGLNHLAFIHPDLGEQQGMNLANEIIVNAGLDPDLVARPDQEVDDARADNKAYWLVVFGIGRFAEIYEGNGARVTSAVSGKRYASSDNYYNRYLMVVKVPVYGYDNMTGQSNQKATVVAVLSPNGLSRTRLDGTYRDAVKATAN